MADYPEDELWFSDVISDPEDDENIPPDRAVALDDYGLTAVEERQPEPLSSYLRREVPEQRNDPGPDSDGSDSDSDSDNSMYSDDPEVTAGREVIYELFGERRPAP